MAKTIKFNLLLDGCTVRDLEGLRENFSIEDMLRYFFNGLLPRWLEVRGYQKQLDAVRGIDPEKGVRSVIAELVRTFDIQAEPEDIEKAAAVLEYLEESKKRDAFYRENAFEKKRIIDDYHAGYHKLIKHMLEHRDHMELLKADAIQLEREYLSLFALDYGSLYHRFEKAAPKAVFAILTRDALWDYWIGKGDPVRWNSQDICYNIKNNLLSEDKLKKALGENLKIVNKDTQSMWFPVERPGVRIMVISLGSSSFVRNAGEANEKFGSEDINYNFLKFDGLDYQSTWSFEPLMYMEV